MHKKAIIERLRAGDFLVLATYFVKDRRYTETWRLAASVGDAGEAVNLPGRTRRSLSLKVARKFVDGREVATDYVPEMRAGLEIKVYYGLASEGV